MKLIIFAGGVGTRLWPLSRKNSPKQFEKIIGDKSTLQQTVERLMPEFKGEDIYIATGKRYQEIVQLQLPQIPKENFVFEPEMRDVGPAIGLMATLIEQKFPNEAIAILWSDHLVKHIDSFKHALKVSEDMLQQKNAKFVFIAQKPRFANQNMGWIEIGEEVEQQETITIYDFKKLRYRPKLEEAKMFFTNKNFVWNLGYFVTTPPFLTKLFKEHAPQMYEKLLQISQKWGTSEFEPLLQSIYPSLEKISFDDAILVKMGSENVFVVSSDLGWSDVGAWESLKEALSKTVDENVTKGNVLLEDSRDSLVFNYTPQLAVGIDLEEMLVINTGDVVLICPKDAVPKIKKLVEQMADSENSHLI